ncbi:MAG: hypothetical protein HKN46_11240, partial [Acidimicrobiia bacterium]|nr:hypothetical protein [Acidimicrobiia bacterium]
ASESLLAAADRAGLLGSFGQVVDLCLRGVDLADDAADRAQLLARAARAAHSALDDRARDLAKRAMDEASASGDPDVALFASTVRAKLLDDVGESHEAWPQLAAVLDEHPGETALHVTALAELARSYMLDGQPQALEVTERALQIAEGLDMDREVAELWATRGAGLATGGRMREAEVLLTAALDLAREHQLLHTKRRAMANLNYMGDSLLTPFVDEVMEDARRLGDDLLLADALQTKAWRAFVMLEWDEEAEILAQVEQLAMNQALRDTMEEVRYGREQLMGDPVGAQQRIEELWSRAGTGDSQTEVNRDLDRASAAFYEGRFRDALEGALAVPHRAPQRPHLNWAAVAALRLGERDGLEAVLEALEGAPLSGITQMRRNALGGALAALDGDMGEAEARFASAGDVALEKWGPLFGGFIVVSARAYLGLDHQLATVWAREIHTRWAELGLTTLLDLYADVLPPLEDSVAETA